MVIEQTPETRRRILAAGIPPRLRGLSLMADERFPLTGVEVSPPDVMQRWIDRLYAGQIVRAEAQLDFCGRGVWAVGPRSSAYLTALMRDFMVRTPATGLYLNVEDYLDSNRPDRDPSAGIRALEVDLLVLANVGSEVPTEWSGGTIRGLLLKRFDDGLPTLVSAICEPTRYLVETLAREVLLRIGTMRKEDE